MKQNLYIRLLEYGLKQTNGFSREELEKHLDLNDWEKRIVSKFIQLALETGRHVPGPNSIYIPDSENTIFVLISNDHPYGARFILSHGAFFSYLDYLELESAKETSKSANRNAKFALWAVFCTTLISIFVSCFLSYWQIKSPVEIDKKQYKALLEYVKQNKLHTNERVRPTP